MDQNQALSNLDYLKTLAESGQRTPLLGGAIGLMWTVLLVPTLVVNGLVLRGDIALPAENIGFVWFVFGITGGILTAIMSRGLKHAKGGGTAANKVASTIWPASSVLIFGFAISIAVGFSLGNLPELAFNFIMPFAFATSALSNIVLARMTGETYLRYAFFMAALFVVITTLIASRPEAYFAAALGVVLSGIIPSFIEVRKEAARD